MHLLIVVLEDPDRAEDVLSACVELEVAGLQVTDTQSVVGLLAAETPIFAGLRQLVNRPRADSKVIFGLTDDEGILNDLTRLLRKVDLDLDASGTGYAFLVPVSKWAGNLDFDTA
jgi:hypothetical protein